MSRTGTNVVRFAVAAMLGLAACLVAWWPQSAAGSGDVAVVSAVVAAPTQNTPTPRATPTATVAPTTAAPPPPPPATATSKPTKKPTKKPTRKPTTLHNNGGNNGGDNGGKNHGSGGISHNDPPATQSSTVSDSTPYVAPVKPSKPAPTTKQSPSAPTAAPTTAVPTTTAATPDAGAGEDDIVEDGAKTYDTYLTSSEPVETTSAPVWVVPGILLVLTAMLALLGGVLGRGTRPLLARVKSSSASDEPTDS